MRYETVMLPETSGCSDTNLRTGIGADMAQTDVDQNRPIFCQKSVQTDPSNKTF